MRVIAWMLVVAAAGVGVRAQTADLLLAVDLGSHLQPIAQVRDGAWVAVPRAGLGRLAPRDWTRWDLTGRASSIRLGVREPAGRCAAPRRLSVPDAPPSTRAGGRSYIGIAASGALPVDSGGAVPESSPEFRRIHDAVLPLFERRVREHALSPTAFAPLPMTVDRAFRSRGSSTSYYFEVSKRVPDAGGTPEEDPKGIVRLTVSGWLRESGGRLVPAGSKGELHWDPADEAAIASSEGLWPLGVFRHRDEQIWVMHERVGVRDSFILYALGETVRHLLTLEASAC